MTPTVISGADVFYGAPAEWDPARDGYCGVLPIRREVDACSRIWMASAWEPTPRELELLNAGGKVILRVSCHQHPVTSLSVEAPPRVDDLVEGRTPPP